MQANKRNLIGMVVVAGLFLAVLLTGMAGSLRAGSRVVVPGVLTVAGLCVIAVWMFRFRVRLMLRDRTPDRLIAHYHRSARRVPYGDATAAYLAALSATFFGEFERARRELEAVDWEKYPPLYRGHRMYALATLALLEKTDYPGALELARRGRELEEMERAGGMQLLDDVIHVVAEGGNAEKIERMDRAANKQNGLVPGMCAWALAVYYKRRNETDKAAEYKQLLRQAVPFSVPLRG